MGRVNPVFLIILVGMKLPITLLTILLLCVFTKGFAQNTPKLTQQLNFTTGLDEVLASERQNAFLAISADNYTLIDQTSKIQLGTLKYNAGNWGSLGEGKTSFWGDSSILISSAFVLLQANPITGQTDTFFNQNKYPEMIENFIPWPNDENKILIHTKTYPLKKDSSISYLKDNSNTNEYLGPVNCKLYLYNAATKTTEIVAETPHLFTVFAPQLYNGTILAGTHGGDIVTIDATLKQTTLTHAFDTAMHHLLACNDYIIATPAMANALVGYNYGDNRICFFKEGKKVKEFIFGEQKPVDQWSMLSPSGTVYRAHYIAPENCVVVNYGFSRLVKIDLATLDTTHYNIPYNMAKFYCTGTDGVRLLAAVDSVQNVFTTARMQTLYDIQSQKFLPAFRPVQPQSQFSQFYKLYDAKGNYHIVGFRGDYNKDSLYIYSSNKTQPTRIACDWCSFSVDAKNQMLGITQFGRGMVGNLQLDKLRESSYTIDSRNTYDIVTPVFSTDKVEYKKLPESLNNIYQLNDSKYLITGTQYKKEKTYFEFLVIDKSGEILVEERGHEYTLSNSHALSATKQYFAIAFNEKSRYRLTVWDLQTMSKVFETKTEKGTDIRHYTFDKTKNVLWYCTSSYDKKANTHHNLLYSVALNNPKPIEKFEGEDPRFFSFEVDMEADRVAFEAYDQLYVAQLSTRKVLWQKEPYESYIQVEHLPTGFSFSNKKELHTLQNDSTYLYFTTYGTDNPVEVLNNYLYKGAKAAVNNLAFTYKNKGFLPAEYDVYFNRPDTVLTLSGSTNQAFNQLIAEAFAKRTRKLGKVSLDDLLTKGPQIQIANKNQLPYVVNSNSIALQIQAKTLFANISTLHIIANGVPIYGEAGLRVQAGNNITLNQTIELLKGNNTLQIFVEDEKGIPSATETINIVADYEIPQPKIFFVGIGIDVFKEEGHNLSYSVKDIRDLAQSLKNKLGDGVVIDTLFNQNVTVENVTALRSKLKQAGVNDKIIISYSGHGLLDKSFNYYLSTYPISFHNPQTGGLPYTTFEGLLDGLAARKKLMLIDACHSGEVDREELDKMKVAFSNTDQNLKDGSKSGIELLVDEEQTVGLKNSFELMQEIFTNVQRGTGTTVISAAAGTQVAYEKGNLKNGVFTYCVLQLLAEKPNCSVQELKNIVSRQVETLTNGLQRPTNRNETAGFDWQVW